MNDPHAKHHFSLAVIASSLALFSMAAGAEETPPAEVTAPPAAFTFAGSVTAVNDYLFRGISQTWGKPALQLWGEMNHQSGLYAGVFASNVSHDMYPGTHYETDLYGGLRGKLPGTLSALNYDVGLTYIYYPGGNFNQAKYVYESSKFNTLEAAVSLNYQWLTVKAGRSLTEFFGWNTNNSAIGSGFNGDLEAGVTGTTKGSWFVEAAAAYEVAPGWSVNASAGRQNINNSTGLDWNYYKAGVTRSFMGTWAANLSWSGISGSDAYDDFLSLQANGDTHDAGRSRVLFSLTKSF